MEGGPPVFPPGFTCPAVLWIQLADFAFRIRDSHTAVSYTHLGRVFIGTDDDLARFADRRRRAVRQNEVDIVKRARDAHGRCV